MMEHYESPRTVFEWLYTRMDGAPKVVVYDNSCHLHGYCLNREPQWVKGTTFVIDKTHYKGHVGCSRGYDITTYPQLTVLNSQLAEQRVRFLCLLYCIHLFADRTLPVAEFQARHAQDALCVHVAANVPRLRAPLLVHISPAACVTGRS